MSDRKLLFIECGVCGERWKVATLPMPIRDAAYMLLGALCPNCGERKDLAMCPTSGTGAVKRARSGRRPEAAHGEVK